MTAVPVALMLVQYQSWIAGDARFCFFFFLVAVVPVRKLRACRQKKYAKRLRGVGLIPVVGYSRISPNDTFNAEIGMNACTM